MATRTSTQSGNFNSTSTWGGSAVPVDGDNFIIAQGHIVTIDDDRRVTNGYNDSYVRGKLHIEDGGKIRMNGILYIDNYSNSTTYFAEGNSTSAGFFRMDPGAICELKGSTADQHSIRMYNKGYTTMEIIGTNPNPQTTLAADANENTTSLTVSDASDFVAGDYITVYKAERTGQNYLYNKSDEGMWVHDVDYLNDVIYPRKFVGPTATIVSISGTSIVLSDASVFRTGYTIIFGTGSNRNIKTISSINYDTNTIVVDSSVSGSVAGESVYRTGLDKYHLNGDDVLRLAAVLTADSDAGDNTITVNNTNGFSVGDMILICANDTEYDGSWDRIEDYVITNINTSTKVITFTAGFSSPSQTTLQKNVKAGIGGLVVNLTRDTKVISPEGTTYGTNNACFIYWDYVAGSPAYYRRIKIKNVEIGCGTNSSSGYYGSIGGRGHQSYDLTSYGQYTFEFNGNAIYPTYRNYAVCGNFWEHHQCVFRNNVLYNSASNGMGRYGNNIGVFNNIITRVANPVYHEGMYSDDAQTCYNYYVRTYYGLSINQFYEPTNTVRQNYAVFLSSTPLIFSYQNGNSYISDCYFDYFTWWYTGDRMNTLIANNCHFGNSWDVTNFQSGGIYANGINSQNVQGQQFHRRASNTTTCISLNHNFKYNGAAQWNGQTWRTYDKSARAWRVYPDRDNPTWRGFTNDVAVPANSKVFITANVKTASGNTYYPYLVARHYIDVQSGKYRNSTEDYLDPVTDGIAHVTSNTGFLSKSRFTSASNSDFETITMTMPALPFDYVLSVGIGVDGTSSNAEYGWWEKDLEIAIENPYGYDEARHLINTLTTRLPVQVKSTSGQLKTILGG